MWIDVWLRVNISSKDIKNQKKSFLHRIVTGDDKWVFYDNPKRKKSWVDPGQPTTWTPKYSWIQGFFVYLVGLKRRGLL